MELHGGEDFLELARSIHTLLRTETASHDALARRVCCANIPPVPSPSPLLSTRCSLQVSELEGALSATTKELSDLRQRNDRWVWLS